VPLVLAVNLMLFGRMVCFDFEGAAINAWVRGLVVLLSTGDLWKITTHSDELEQVQLTMSTDDVYSRKKAFLEAQVRRLTTTLGPSREYKPTAASTTVEDGDRLSETIVDNAIYKCTSPTFKT
jgi:hypothetical protein